MADCISKVFQTAAQAQMCVDQANTETAASGNGYFYEVQRHMIAPMIDESARFTRSSTNYSASPIDSCKLKEWQVGDLFSSEVPACLDMINKSFPGRGTSIENDGCFIGIFGGDVCFKDYLKIVIKE